MAKWKQGIDIPLLPMELASISALQGDKAAAREWLQRAIERGWRDRFILRTNPMLASVHKEPWFQDTLAYLDRELRRMREESVEIPALFSKTLPSLPPPPARK
ncbi:MAG: hypothetical protein SFV54_16395 [Bryobacteraceae bacterium]|nr:hypothetical protein [Bryobacteraceae bacterium]